jgi:anti-sigma regulatory factor (Ser/Thr protein kinase)
MAFVHEALYYANVAEFLAGTVSFIRAGLDRAEPVLVAVPESRLSLIRAELSFSSAVTFVNMAVDGRNPNRILPWIFGAFADRHRHRVSIVAETCYPERRPEEVPLCVQHEALVNVAFAERDAALLCPYDISQLPHVVPYVERTHPQVLVAEARRPSSSYTDPSTVVALLNQPLPDRRRVDEAVTYQLDGVPDVVRKVVAHATAAGLADERVTDFSLAVREIGTNAIAHSGGHAATIRLWADPDRVVCEIKGAGVMSDMMAGRIFPAPESPRGRGLLIANRLCDLVQIHSAPAGTTIRLHMRLSST